MKELLNKVATIRTKVIDGNIKKSGKNKHSGFQYYELADFLPLVTKLEQELRLVSLFDTLTNETAILTVYDLDSDNKLTLTTKIADVNVNSMIEIQRLGSQHTYLKRYLYYNYLNLTENDEVDSLEQKTATQPKPTPTPQVVQPKPTVQPTQELPIAPATKAEVKTELTDKDILKSMVNVKTIEDLNDLWAKAQSINITDGTKNLFNFKATNLKAKLINNKWEV